MKILFFIDSLRAGGKERRFTELLKSLSSFPDIEFEIVLMNRNIHYQEILDLNVPLHYLIRKTKKDLTVFRKFYNVCKEYKPDIVHSWTDMTSVIAVPACKLLSIIMVNGMVIDTPIEKNIFNKYWLRAKLTFPFSDVIIGNSKAGLLAYNAPSKKSLVIYNGYNFERNNYAVNKNKIWDQLNISTKYVIAMVATFSENKDYKTYFEAAEIILSGRKDVTFLAIGQHTDSSDAKKMVNKNFRHDYFRFLGQKSNIESYINIADIGILATFTEGISNSIMEFMAAGKPVIATDGGGTNEILQDHKTGYLVKVSDPLELAHKIEVLLSDDNKRIEMGKTGRKRIETFFSIDLMANSFSSIYTKLIGEQVKSSKIVVPHINSAESERFGNKIPIN